MKNNDNEREIYQKIHQEEIQRGLEYFCEQHPALWLTFVTNILPKLAKIAGYEQKIKNNEKRIERLDTEIKQRTKVVSGQEAVIGLSGNGFVNGIEYLHKAGLSSVPIVTLFAITGVTSILNPFINPQHRWGVLFILWSSISFVLLTSAGIVKLVHRLNRQHWQYVFWGLTVRSWFVIGCLVFGIIEGLGGGALATSLINKAIAEANELMDTALPLLDFWGQAKIIAIMSLFACVNIFFSVAKGFEIRTLQPNKIKRNQALSQLKIAKDNLQKLVDENKELAAIIEHLKQEVAFVMPLEEWQRDIRNMSNENTQGQDFRGKHPGTYTPKNNSNNSPATNNGHNGHGSVNSMNEVEFLSSDSLTEINEDN